MTRVRFPHGPRGGGFSPDFKGYSEIVRAFPQKKSGAKLLQRHAGFHLLRDFIDESREIGIGRHFGFDFVAGVHDRGVVFAAKTLADFGGGTLGERARQVHGDLPWESDGVRAAFALHVF